MRSGVFFETYARDMALRRYPLEKLRMALFLSLLVVFPFFASNYWLNLANQIALYTIGALGLNILVGYTGQISLGQGAFLAMGAYGSGLLVTQVGLPFVVAIPLAGLGTAAVGIVAGLPSLRLKGLYLAIATLAMQQIVEWAITHWQTILELFGIEREGASSEALRVPYVDFLSKTGTRDLHFYWIVVPLTLLVALGTANLFRSRVGRAFVAIRDQDIAASAMGIPVYGYKLLAFATSSFVVAIAGGLIPLYRGIVTWERFTLEVSILYLAMIIVGGLGTISGSFFGATLMVLLPALITVVGRDLQGTAPAVAAKLPYVQSGVFGLVLVLFLVLEPEGLAKLWRNIKDWFRVWPFSY